MTKKSAKKTAKKDTKERRPAGAKTSDKKKAAQIDAAAIDRVIKPEVVAGDNVDLVNGFKTTTKARLNTIARGYDNLKSDAAATSQAIGDMLTKSVERYHLDKPAFQMAMKIRKMSQAKKARFVPVFMKYLEDLGVFEEAAAQAEMFKDENDDDGGQTELERQAEAAAAATALAPARKPSMRIVPKEEEPNDPPRSAAAE